MVCDPFDHVVIDDFLDLGLATQLSLEFMDYSSDNWFNYNNPLEHKKTNNNWYLFPPLTYQYMSYLNSPEFIKRIEDITSINGLLPDIGLHGAGWHIHGSGGKLNIHLDYSIHPKLKLLRKLNLILYLSEDWNPKWGGGLQLWSNDPLNNKPLKLEKTVDVKFNRAVLFDTTQYSWHGFPDPLVCPDNVYRKSIAMYYLVHPSENVDKRSRALYAPSKDQEKNPAIIKFIEDRSK